MTKRKPSLSGTIANLVQLIPNVISIVANVTALVNLEARLATKNLLVIILLSVVFAILLVSTWLCLLVFLYLGLLALNLSSLLSLLVCFLFNTFLLIIIGFWMNRLKRSLFFPCTRHELSSND